ncbi:hypothetical protein ACQPZJ_17645 [Actinoplanes sp. CA-054009]
MRFEPLEAAIIVASFLVFALGLLAGLSEMRAITELTEHGRCVDARVEKAGSGNSLRLGRSADIIYTVGGTTYRAALHYDSDHALQVYSTIEICTAEADPRRFAVDSPEVTGDSTSLWLRGVIGDPVLAVGLIAFLLMVGKHQWRFHRE